MGQDAYDARKYCTLSQHACEDKQYFQKAQSQPEDYLIYSTFIESAEICKLIFPGCS